MGTAWLPAKILRARPKTAVGVRDSVAAVMPLIKSLAAVSRRGRRLSELGESELVWSSGDLEPFLEAADDSLLAADSDR